MKEKVLQLIGNNLDCFNVWIDDVLYEKADNNKYLRIILDSKDIISLNLIVEITKVINSIFDKCDTSFIDEKYILDIYAKSKGDDINE